MDGKCMDYNDRTVDMQLLKTNGTKDGVSMLAVLYAREFYR